MAKAVIQDVKDQRLVSIKASDSYRAKIVYDLPFHVRFINVGIPGFGPNNTAPIGIAVIGFNNYIL